MSRAKEPDNPVERLRAALDEWLDAFDAESSALIRSELAQIGPSDTPARLALVEQDNHLAAATKHFDDALQMRWLVSQYRTAAAGMQREVPDEE